MLTKEAFIDQPGISRSTNYFHRWNKSEGYRIQSLWQSQAHFTVETPTHNMGMIVFWNDTCFQNIQPSSTYKQLGFSLLLHLNFKNLETVNTELSALELILFLAATI